MNVPIAIVGAGPIGMFSALLLSKLKIPSVIIESTPHKFNQSTLPHPKAHVLHTRAIELFRQIGLEQVRLHEYTRVLTFTFKGDMGTCTPCR